MKTALRLNTALFSTVSWFHFYLFPRVCCSARFACREASGGALSGVRSFARHQTWPQMTTVVKPFGLRVAAGVSLSSALAQACLFKKGLYIFFFPQNVEGKHYMALKQCFLAARNCGILGSQRCTTHRAERILVLHQRFFSFNTKLREMPPLKRVGELTA